MRRHPAFFLGLGLAGMLVMPRSAAAQVKPVVAPSQPEQTQPRRPADAATRAIRREAESNAKERERMFAKIRRLELSGAQPVVRRVPQRPPAIDPAAVAVGRAQRIQARIAVMADGLVIRGEFFAPEPEKPPDDQDEPEDAENENRPVFPFRQQRFIVADENFDQWIFSGDTIEERRDRMNNNLRRTIERVDRARRLTAVQRQKLELAGRGNIKHFFDQVETKRREFDQVRTDLQKCRAFARDLRPLRQAYVTGPFDEGSLFSKILRTMRPYSR
jgi:hypothetical protein